MEWEKLFRKYIWDDQTTPYQVPLAKLNRRQADSEILVYSLFQGIFFAIVVIASLRGGPDGRSLGPAFYGFSVICAAALFGMLKSYPAALYLSATPLAALAYLFLYGFSSERARMDTIFVTIVLLLLLRYSLRIVALARAYPGLPEPRDDKTPRRRQ
ncbi:MAG: hypothetical protein ACR2OX_13170 [Methyloligellaceae bacterium]